MSPKRKTKTRYKVYKNSYFIEKRKNRIIPKFMYVWLILGGFYMVLLFLFFLVKLSWG